MNHLSTKTEKIIINEHNSIHLLNCNEILFCKSDNYYTSIFMRNGASFIVTKSLSKFSEQLNNKEFIRVNQSFLLNTNFIVSINKKQRHIIMSNNEIIPFTVTIKKLMLLISLAPNLALLQ